MPIDPETTDKLVDVLADLRVALLQSLPSDDQIIMDRVRKATAILAGVVGAARAAERAARKGEA